MKTYETVTEAINDLAKRGYTDDLNISSVRASLPEEERKTLSANDFDIDEVHRFEGDSDPADETILFAVSSNRFHLKAFLVNAYGMYEDEGTFELIKALHQRVR